MSRETEFQAEVLDKARSQGYLAQRFSDELAVGIPDTFLGSPFAGMWIECKWKVWPKKSETPLLTLGDNGLRGTQWNWLMQAWRRPNLSGCLIGTPLGWIVVPAPAIMKNLIEGGALQLRDRMVAGTPTVERIHEELNMGRW